MVIRTFDGRIVHLPSNELLDSPIVNNSTSGARRSEVEVRAATGVGSTAIVATIRAAVVVAEGVLPEPAPAITVRAIENERLTALVQFWHLPHAGLTTTGTVVEAIGAAVANDGTAVTVITPPPVAPLTPPAPQ